MVTWDGDPGMVTWDGDLVWWPPLFLYAVGGFKGCSYITNSNTSSHCSSPEHSDEWDSYSRISQAPFCSMRHTTIAFNRRAYPEYLELALLEHCEELRYLRR